jgi:hypothetical protein
MIGVMCAMWRWKVMRLIVRNAWCQISNTGNVIWLERRKAVFSFTAMNEPLLWCAPSGFRVCLSKPAPRKLESKEGTGVQLEIQRNLKRKIDFFVCVPEYCALSIDWLSLWLANEFPNKSNRTSMLPPGAHIARPPIYESLTRNCQVNLVHFQQLYHPLRSQREIYAH